MIKRNLHIAILSDVHLGAYACHADELLKYFQSISPEVLVLNGDFLDPSQEGIGKLPKAHRKVVAAIVNLANEGTKVYCVSDDIEKVFQRFPEFSSFGISVREELVLQLKGDKYWILHGGKKHATTIATTLSARLNRLAYRLLLNGNKMLNKWQLHSGKANMSYIGTLKNKAKHAWQLVEEFEKTAVHLATQQGYQNVICGHLHEPAIKEIEKDGARIRYMNAGDWVENLTALEYRFEKWSIYRYDELDYNFVNPKLHVRAKNVKRAKSDNEIETNGSSNSETQEERSELQERKLKSQ